MPESLQIAFKEWAVVCRALALGRQIVILRKGGIAEHHDRFELEHTRFWLYPTYVHQQESGIREDALPLLEEAVRERPPEGMVRISHFAEVVHAYRLHDIVGAMLLAPYHIWSQETVEARFRYRWPGLYAFVVRVQGAYEPIDVPELSTYAGCKSWVELAQAVPTNLSGPVVADAQFNEHCTEIERLLKPTALA